MAAAAADLLAEGADLLADGDVRAAFASFDGAVGVLRKEGGSGGSSSRDLALALAKRANAAGMVVAQLGGDAQAAVVDGGALTAAQCAVEAADALSGLGDDAKKGDAAVSRALKGLSKTCFALGEFSACVRALEALLGEDSNDNTDEESLLLLRKCRAELAENGAFVPSSSSGSSSAAGEKVEETAKEPAQKKLKGEDASSVSATADSQPEQQQPEQQQQQQQQQVAAAPPKLRHEWYQTASHVFVNIFRKGLKEEDLTIEKTATSLSVEIQLGADHEAQFDFDLFGEIDAEASTYKIMSTKIEFKLQKKSGGAMWASLERTEATPAPAAAAAVAAVPDPALGVHKPAPRKNWDKIAADEGADEEEKLEGDAALNKVFQDIFGRGSDEQKKAMMKSFTESGGTVLSTNWDEVGAKKVEGSAPDGQVMHKIDPYGN